MEKDISGIYSITNIENGKLYIGSSKNIHKRWKQHINALNKNKHHSTHLQNAWNRYGEEKFVFEIIEKCKEEILLIKEQYYIDLYSSANNLFGYNESEFAGKPSMTAEQRAYYGKISSERLKGEGSWCNIYSEDQIKKLIEDLKTGDYSYVQLSEKHNISYDIVASVASHSSWTYLTDNIVFPKPKKYTRKNVKLTSDNVEEIISLILHGECNKNIAKLFDVAPKTISDIRNHKTWIDMTENMTFPKSPKNKAYDHSIEAEVKQLRKKFKLTYAEIAERLGISMSYVCALNNK